MKKSLRITAIFLALLATSPASALLVAKLNLAQLVAFSDRIFRGQCISVKEGIDVNNRPVRFVTYRVSQMLKGEESPRVTFKQISAPREEESGDVAVRSAFRDMPRYQVGSEDIVFLSGESEIGLSAPIGIGQGIFQVLEKEGVKSVVNRTGNQWLFQSLKKSPLFKGLTLSSSEKELMRGEGEILPLEPFVSLVRKLVEAAP